MSSSAADSPPPEISEAILRLLPAKSLGRFKSVSKTWCSLISDHQFIKNHLHQNNKNKTIKLILITEDKSLYSLDITEASSATANKLTFSSTCSIMRTILGSCNGIVSTRDENGTVFLMNPTTKELWEVPPSSLFTPARFVIFNMYGFGYDSSTDDYKVVTVVFWKGEGFNRDYKVSVYSLRNNSWKELRNYDFGNLTTLQFTGVVVNENVHWMMRGPTGGLLMIVAFSLGNEEFKEIKLPDKVEKDGVVFEELCVVGGKLGFFGTLAGLWVMEEYGVSESWTKVCTDGLEINPCEQFSFVEGVNRDIVLHREDGVFVLYNLDERRRRNVTIDEGLIGIDIEMDAVYFEGVECIRRVMGAVYFESLECIRRVTSRACS